MSDSRRDSTMSNRSTDGVPVKITREIPLPWLVGLAGLLIGQAATVWFTQQAQGKALQDLTTEVRELRQAVNAGTLKTVEHAVKLADHDRRIQALEQRPRP